MSKLWAKMTRQGGGIAGHLRRAHCLDGSFWGSKSPPGAHCLREEGTAGEVSRGPAVIGFQQSAQALEADDLALVSFMLGLDDLVKALVNPLVMIVGEILAQDIAQLFSRR